MKSSETIYLVDGQSFNCKSFGLDSKSETFLFERRILNSSGYSVHLNFVGLIHIQNKVFICLPKTSDLNSDKILLLKNSRLLVKSLIKFGRENDIVEQYEDSQRKVQDEIVLNQLQSTLYILDDYRKYGVLNFTEAVIQEKSNGKINWSKTIKRGSPFINDNQEPVYSKLMVKKNIIKNNDLLTSIHKYFIQYSDNMLGWYFSDSGRVYKTTELESDLSMPCSVPVAITIIKKALSIEYSNRKINLYKKLLILLYNREHSEVGSLLGVSDYWRVWEFMAKKVFNDVYDSNYSSDIPQPRYLYPDGSYSSEAIGQRFDLITEYKNALYIIDAKYYDVLKTKPGWKDIVKQFFYEKSLRLLSDKIVVNVLIFPDPGKDQINKPTRIEMKSFTNKIPKDKLAEEFPTILCHYYKIWDMIDCYSSNLTNNENLENIESVYQIQL